MSSLRLNVTGKFMLAVSAILIVLLSADVYLRNSRVSGQAEESFLDKMRQITGTATTAGNWAAAHRQAFVQDAEENDGDVDTISVMQAWQVARDYAVTQGMELRTPSLAPNNPANAADAFEREALLAFAANRTLREFYRREEINGKEYLRFAVPVLFEESCLGCHDHSISGKDSNSYAKAAMMTSDLQAAFAVKAPTEELIANNSANTRYGILSSLAVLICICGSIYYLVRAVVCRPLARVVAATAQMNQEFRQFVEVTDAVAHNDLTRPLKICEHESLGISSSDEIGVLARAIEDTLETKTEIGKSMATMTANLKTMIKSLALNGNQVVDAATRIAASAEQTSRGAQDQADQVRQVSAAIEEMAATIVQTTTNAGEATDASRNASHTATQGGDIVAKTIQGMQSINKVVRESADSIVKLAESADQIGEITRVIDDIADQTNLLALNAAIEAARAGEQGRGFAVVADEVRKLAERTGKATGEITQMIKGIQEQTEEAVQSMETGIQQVDSGRELADKAGNALSEIVSVSQLVMDMIQQIATASEEQAAAAEQISRNLEHISSVAAQSARGAEESASASEELNRQAEALQQIVSKFSIE